MRHECDEVIRCQNSKDHSTTSTTIARRERHCPLRLVSHPQRNADLKRRVGECRHLVKARQTRGVLRRGDDVVSIKHHRPDLVSLRWTTISSGQPLRHGEPTGGRATAHCSDSRVRGVSVRTISDPAHSLITDKRYRRGADFVGLSAFRQPCLRPLPPRHVLPASRRASPASLSNGRSCVRATARARTTRPPGRAMDQRVRAARVARRPLWASGPRR